MILYLDIGLLLQILLIFQAHYYTKSAINMNANKPLIPTPIFRVSETLGNNPQTFTILQFRPDLAEPPSC